MNGLVRGLCPACGLAALFLGDGGHVTCSNLPCPDPGAADALLARRRGTSTSGPVPDAAVEAAIDAAGWAWEPEDHVPSPAACMRPILEAALPHLVAPVLRLHPRQVVGGKPTCGLCTEFDGPEEDAPEVFAAWPCPTLRALGVEPAEPPPAVPS